VHNTEVNGNIAYSSWYSHGIVAWDPVGLSAGDCGGCSGGALSSSRYSRRSRILQVQAPPAEPLP